MLLLQIQFSWVSYNTLCLIYLFYELLLLCKLYFLVLALAFLIVYALVFDYHRVCYVCASLHVWPFILHVISLWHNSWHHANVSNNSCIIVTETQENKPVEPAEVAEPKPRVRVRGWTRGKPRQAAMHYSLHIFNLI